MPAVLRVVPAPDPSSDEALIAPPTVIELVAVALAGALTLGWLSAGPLWSALRGVYLLYTMGSGGFLGFLDFVLVATQLVVGLGLSAAVVVGAYRVLNRGPRALLVRAIRGSALHVAIFGIALPVLVLLLQAHSLWMAAVTHGHGFKVFDLGAAAFVSAIAIEVSVCTVVVWCGCVLAFRPSYDEV